MEFLIAVLLACMVLLLFYRFVERRHKLVVLGVLGIVAVLGISGIGYSLWREHRADVADQQLKRSVAITLVLPRLASDTLNPADPLLAAIARMNRPDTLTSITFRLCNTGEDTVTSVTFYPQAFRSGRSTSYDVRVPRQGDYSANRFDSDFILAPARCQELTWGKGRYLVLDSVAAFPMSVTVRASSER